MDGAPPRAKGWILYSLIITPTRYKDKYYNEKPFKELWITAKTHLSKCEKLVVIGYSFSPTDFATKQLFLESFKENNLKELVIVNPNFSLVKVVKNLCHFMGGIVWFQDLNEYINSRAR